jgi:hypothetical protein
MRKFNLKEKALTFGLMALLLIGLVVSSSPISAAMAFGTPMVQVEQGFFRLAGRKDNVHKMSVKAGQNVAVMVNGDESTDLDVWVYDTDGDLVGSGEEDGDQEEVRFKANQTGTYTIRVSNQGQVINVYQLSF